MKVDIRGLMSGNTSVHEAGVILVVDESIKVEFTEREKKTKQRIWRVWKGRQKKGNCSEPGERSVV